MNKKIIAVIIAVVLMVSVTVPALANEAAWRVIEGDGTVNNPELRVIVPTSLDFAFDPFKIDGGESQVADVSFELINKSFAAVGAIFYLDAEFDSAKVTMIARADQDDALNFSMADMTMRDKVLSMGVIGAKTITPGATAFADLAFANDATVVYDSEEDGTLIEFDVDKQADIGFVLAAATRTPDALANNAEGLAAFQFFAEMNSYAPWQDGDVNVSGVLWLTALHPDTLVGDDAIETVGRGIIPAEDTPERPADMSDLMAPPAKGFFGSAPGFARTSITAATLKPDLTSGQIVIPFVGATTANTSVRFTTSTGTAMNTADYSVTATGVTFSATRSNSIRGLTDPTTYFIVVGGVAHQLNILVD
jgi:hypothetical protein